MRPLTGTFNKDDYPNLLVGLDAPDDAAVYQLDEHRAIISTTDFFPPVVDDAYDFGAIAAANALSDVYAMGGTPLMAINLAAFPDGYSMSILTDILRGGADVVRQAGAVVAGGHTVADKEPKYGLCVTGEVHPAHIITKSGAQPGDALILTKPLGAGVITTALKGGQASDAHIAHVVTGMKHLNRYPAELAQHYNQQVATSNAPSDRIVRAMTDITGYSLLGHAHEMAHLSGVVFDINFNALRWYDGAFDYAKADLFPGGMSRNQDYFAQWVTLSPGLADWQESLLYDPQTSGGLLIAVQPDHSEAFLAQLLQAGEQAALIGWVSSGVGGTIRMHDG